MTRYVTVTTVSMFRHRYVIPEEALQIDGPCTDEQLMIGAKDFVTMNEVKEFSQEHIDETVIDANIINEPEALLLIDRDNPYWKSWSVEAKIDFMKSWTEEMDAERVKRFQQNPENQERYHDYLLRMEKQLREANESNI